MSRQNKFFPELNTVFTPDSRNNPDSFLSRAANILVCLSEGIDTVTEVARACKLSASTTHRILQALTDTRLAIYDASNRRYYLGTLVSRLVSNSYTTHRYLVCCALKEMYRLLEVSGETVTLDAAVGIEYFHLHAVHSMHSIRVQGDYSRRLQSLIPLGASQKVLLSQLNEKDLNIALKIAANWFEDNYSLSEIDIEEWKSQLDRIKKQGYAVTRGESIPGGLGISVPVFNYQQPVALTILGPENRISDRVEGFTGELLVSGARLSKLILEVIPGDNP